MLVCSWKPLATTCGAAPSGDTHRMAPSAAFGELTFVQQGRPSKSTRASARISPVARTVTGPPCLGMRRIDSVLGVDPIEVVVVDSDPGRQGLSLEKRLGSPGRVVAFLIAPRPRAPPRSVQ